MRIFRLQSKPVKNPITSTSVHLHRRLSSSFVNTTHYVTNNGGSSTYSHSGSSNNKHYRYFASSSLQQKHFQMKARCNFNHPWSSSQCTNRHYSIVTTTTSSGVDDSTETPSSSKSSSINPTEQTATMTISKEQQEEMDLLLERAYNQARKISLLALHKQNKHDDSLNEIGVASHQYLPTINNSSINASINTTIKKKKKKQKIKNEIHKNEQHTKQQQQQKNQQQEHHILQQQIYNIESEMDIQYQTNAAEALLKLTSSSNFQFAFRQKQDQQQMQQIQEMGQSLDDKSHNVVLSLHLAFLSVIHWLCTTLSTTSTIGTGQMSSLSSSISSSSTTSSTSSSMKQNLTSFTNFTSIPSSSTTTTTSTFSNNTMTTTNDTTTNNDFSKNNNDPMPFPTKESIILNYILSLVDRCQSLNLPLTLPLYETICTLLSKHCNESSNISLMVLDLSTLARDALSSTTSSSTSTNQNNTINSQIIQASFFSNTLKELLHKNKLRDMIELFHGMRNIHNIHKVDLNTGIELLSLLKDKVDENVQFKQNIVEILNDDIESKNKNDTTVTGSGPITTMNNDYELFDESDAMELALILQVPVMEELNMKRKELESYQYDAIESMFDHRYDDEDATNDEWDNQTVYDEEYEEDDEYENYDLSDSGVGDGEEEEEEEDQIMIENANSELDNIELEKDMSRLNYLVACMKDSSDESVKEEAQAMAVSILEKMNRIRASHDMTKPKQAVASDEIKGINAKLHLNSSTGEVEKVEFRFHHGATVSKRKEEAYNKMIRDMVYIRDTANWEIPDIVPQLEEWNGNVGLSFTKEFEEEMMKEVSREDFFEDDEDLDE